MKLGAGKFEKWLSPEIVNLLVSTYAKTSPNGNLSWGYGSLPNRVWGRYSPRKKELIVNKSKTTDQFKQQVETILHEIQHWNQHVAVMKEGEKIWSTNDFEKVYSAESASSGYWDNKYEIDARAFAKANLDAAIAAIGRKYGDKVEGSLDDALEELVDLAVDAGNTLTRGEIGATLRDYNQNSPQNLARAIQELKGLGIRVASDEDAHLRGRVIRLANARPELRPLLLNLLQKP